MLDKYITFLKAHERLVIIFLVLLTGAWAFNKYIDSSAKQADLKQAIANQQLIDAKEASKDAANQYQATIQALTQQNIALNQAVAQRNTVLKKQQTVDANLTPPQLVGRWQTLIGANDSDFTFTTAGIGVSSSAATQTVQTLEEVPVLRQNVSDTQTVADNIKKELDSSQKLVYSLNSEIDAKDKQCDAQTAALKADARKSKRNWFLRGMAAGGAIVAYIVLHY